MQDILAPTKKNTVWIRGWVIEKLFDPVRHRGYYALRPKDCGIILCICVIMLAVIIAAHGKSCVKHSYKTVGEHDLSFA